MNIALGRVADRQQHTQCDRYNIDAECAVSTKFKVRISRWLFSLQLSPPYLFADTVHPFLGRDIFVKAHYVIHVRPVNGSLTPLRERL